MINRAMFYRHYQDKYDLVAKIFEEAANQLVEDMKPLHKDSDPGEKVEIWNQFFEHVGEHARLYQAMLGKNGSPWFAARMREHIIKLILERERRWKPVNFFLLDWVFSLPYPFRCDEERVDEAGQTQPYRIGKVPPFFPYGAIRGNAKMIASLNDEA